MLTQLSSTLRDARARTGVEIPQSRGNGWLDESRQLSKPHQVTVCHQVFYRRLKWSLIQRIHQVESWMAAAPLKRITTITHACLAFHHPLC
jgi:hypothetical protein